LFKEIDGSYTRIHMCGLPQKTTTAENKDCSEGAFPSKDGKQLDGVFCECWKDGCNKSTILAFLSVKKMLLLWIPHVLSAVLYKLK
jgi:hypothetical protein